MDEKAIQILMDEKAIQILEEIKKELQDIRSILEHGNQAQNKNFTEYLFKNVIPYHAEKTKTNLPHQSGNQCDEV